MSYYHKHYINICGECCKKSDIFNDLEKNKIDIEKEQFVLICIGKLWENDLTFDDIIEEDQKLKYSLILLINIKNYFILFFLLMKLLMVFTIKPQFNTTLAHISCFPPVINSYPSCYSIYLNISFGFLLGLDNTLL